MFAACWSVKGGSGTTVVAAALGLVLARSGVEGAVLVDLGGDLPAVLGLAEPTGPGLAGWFSAGASVPADALARLEVPVADRLSLVPRGAGPLAPSDRVDSLLVTLGAEARSVIVDCGTLPIGDRSGSASAVVGRLVADAAPASLFVTRPCYLSLRRWVASSLHPTGVVLVSEPGRALGRRDIEDVVGTDVVAEVPVDTAVARSVDAGLLAGRLPAVLGRALGRAV